MSYIMAALEFVKMSLHNWWHGYEELDLGIFEHFDDEAGKGVADENNITRTK